jgi:hypothetical protein
VKRRAQVAAVVLAALALPAAALANYGGKLDSPGAGIELSASFDHGSPKAVTSFEFHNVPTSCGSYGTSATTGNVDKDIKVKDDKFHKTVHQNSGRETIKIRGHFSDDAKKASGTLRVTGTISGCSTSDTGVVHWHVHKHKK